MMMIHHCIQSLTIILLVFSIGKGYGSHYDIYPGRGQRTPKVNGVGGEGGGGGGGGIDGSGSEVLPEVNAVLLKCPKNKRLRLWQSGGGVGGGGGGGVGGDGKSQENCESQLMVNIRVNPSFHVEKLDKFLVLDEVFDPRLRTKAKILSPYLIEISRGEPVMMYPLEFSKVNDY